jgi:1-acyl-sn-glycerol-3-phosphate acyltransferase
MSVVNREPKAEGIEPAMSSRRQPNDVRRPPTAEASPQAPSPLLSFAAWLWYCALWCPCFAISQVWFRYRFTGKCHVPGSGPVLLVSNHQSHLDPVLIGIACPRQLKYLARIGLFFWPFSWWIRALGAVPLNQESALGGIKTTIKLLKEGNAVVVFPEGSRTPDGKLHPMLPGFCVLARRSGATIVPVAIDGAFHALPRGSGFPRPQRIHLAFGPPLTNQQATSLADEQLVAIVERRIREALNREA